MIPVRQFNHFDTVEVMQAHAKACRERIRNAQARPAPQAKFVIIRRAKNWRVIYPQPIGPVFVRDYLFIASGPRKITGQQILAEVCLKHGVTKGDILSARRQRHIVIAKREVCFRLRRETQMSFPQIGDILNKDHSSVVHSFYKHLDENPDDVRACERASLKNWKEAEARNVIRNGGYRATLRKQRSRAQAVAL